MKMASRDKRRKRWDQNATAKISFPLHVQLIRLCVSAVILLQGLESYNFDRCVYTVKSYNDILWTVDIE